MKVVVVSARQGQTANDRKVLNAVSAVQQAPSLSTDGIFLNRIVHAHFFFKFTNPDANNSCTFYVQLWWWNPITEMWHKGARLAVNDSDINTVECQGLNRVYMQVDDVVYTGSDTPTLDAWIGMVVQV